MDLGAVQGPEQAEAVIFKENDLERLRKEMPRIADFVSDLTPEDQKALDYVLNDYGLSVTAFLGEKEKTEESLC